MAASSSKLFGKHSRFFSHQTVTRFEADGDYLSNLPVELFRKIICSISEPADHINLALVSRHFYYLVMSLLCSTPLELTEENLHNIAQIRNLINQRNVFKESDLLKIKTIMEHFNFDRNRSILPKFVRVAESFYFENHSRTTGALKTVLFKSITKVSKKRTVNLQLAEKENYFRVAILLLCLPGIWALLIIPYFKVFSASAFLLFGVSVFGPMMLLSLDVHTRLAYLFFTAPLLYTDITSVEDLHCCCRNFFRTYFPDYEETDQPLYQTTSRHIQANLHSLLFDYKKQKQLNIVDDMIYEPSLEICIEDNVTSCIDSNTEIDEPVRYNLFGDSSDSEEYSESHALIY